MCGSYQNDHRVQKISVKFDWTESFDYTGGNLDMLKAISDMRKDQVLQAYQYFVGSISE